MPRNIPAYGFFGLGLAFVIVIPAAFAGQADTLKLERIVISKDRFQIPHLYQLNQEKIKPLPFNSALSALGLLSVDLQSRSPQGAIQSDFSLRGSNYEGVLVLLDGQKINDPQSGHHNSDIPLTLADIGRIEVAPGVSTALFAPGAMGGAVYLSVKKPKRKEGILEFSGGEHNSFAGLFSATEKAGDLGLRVSIENDESSGFSYDTDFKKFTSSLTSSLELPKGELGLTFGYQEKEFGAYDFYTPGSGYPSKEWTKVYLVNSGLSLDSAGLLIKPNFLWRRHYDKFLLDKTLIRSLYLSHHENNIFNPSIYIEKDAGSLGRIGLGTEYTAELINSTTLGKHQRSNESVFFDASRSFFSSLSLGLCARLDNFDSFGEVFSGALNNEYQWGKNAKIDLSLKYNTRIPTFTELYYNDPTTLGNPDLAAEESVGSELGYLYEQDDLKSGVRLFYRQEHDMIDWVKKSASQAKFQVENITRDYVAGTEANFEYRFNRYINTLVNYTFINKHIFGQGYIYKYGQNYAKHFFNWLLEFKLPFGTQAICLTYKKKPGRSGWFLCSSRFSCNIFSSSQLFLNITNLFDKQYQEIEGVAQPGRWIEAGLRMEW